MKEVRLKNQQSELAHLNRDLKNHRNLESGGASRVLWSNVSFWAPISSSAALPGVSSASTHLPAEKGSSLPPKVAHSIQGQLGLSGIWKVLPYLEVKSTSP